LGTKVVSSKGKNLPEPGNLLFLIVPASVTHEVWRVTKPELQIGGKEEGEGESNQI